LIKLVKVEGNAGPQLPLSEKVSRLTEKSKKLKAKNGTIVEISHISSAK